MGEEITDKKKGLRRWTFTWNNYQEDTNFEDPEDKYEKWAKCKDYDWRKTIITKLKPSFLIGGRETAPTTGTPHIQGYMEFDNRKNLSTIIKYCKGIALFGSKGSAEDNIEYCSKGENFFKWGEVKQQGQRNDLNEAMEDIRNGTSELEMFEKHTLTMCRYPKAMEKYRLLINKKKMSQIIPKTVECYFGETGTGKTEKAVIENMESYFIVSGTSTGLWFDGYDGEKTIIFDDFRDCHTELSRLLRYLDRYQNTLPVKGGTIMNCAEKFILTSNVDPRDWYRGTDKESKKGLMRRISKAILFKKNENGETTTKEVNLNGEEDWFKKEKRTNPMM